jgi:hypothetical protein
MVTLLIDNVRLSGSIHFNGPWGFLPPSKIIPPLDCKSLKKPRNGYFPYPVEEIFDNVCLHNHVFQSSMVWFLIRDKDDFVFTSNSPIGKDVWDDAVQHRAAMIIQRRFLNWRRERRIKAITVIQRNCNNWIDKPITKDGKEGIACRIMKKKLYKSGRKVF